MVPHLTISEWLLICATIAGPVFAVQAQKFIERARESRLRRLRLFYTLMATRAERLSGDHVKALNMIDIEFYGRSIFGTRFQRSKEKRVVEAWRIYFDHLSEQFDATGVVEWSKRGENLFVDLLHAISLALNYDFDKVQLKRGVYQPRAHGEAELALLSIRDNLMKVLTGEKALPMEVKSFPISNEDAERQREVQKLLLEHLRGKAPIRVAVDREQ